MLFSHSKNISLDGLYLKWFLTLIKYISVQIPWQYYTGYIYAPLTDIY